MNPVKGDDVISKRRLLFSVTAADLEMQTFCTGGNGGQHRNAKQNGVRLIHKASGARAEHRDGRDQGKNKIEAFKKLVETPEFKKWHKVEVSRRLGKEAIVDAEVEAAMKPGNIRVEVKSEEGLWMEDK
jgi:protein subunit release factor A